MSDPSPIASPRFDDTRRADQLLGSLARASSPALMREVEEPLFRALADSPYPDTALIGFERYCSARSDVMPLLTLLARQPATLERLVTVLGHSRMVADTLVRNPEFLELLDPHELRLRTRDALVADARASTRAFRTQPGQLNALRRFKRREMLRICAADVLGLADFEEVAAQLSLLADACLEESLRLCWSALEAEAGPPITAAGGPLPFCIISLGKLGGGELNYASDIDITFVAGDDDGSDGPERRHAAAFFDRLAGGVIQAMGQVTEEGFVFRVDCRLRPEGAQGPLVRTLGGYRRYYAERGRPWERQALIKARCSAGDAALGAEFVRVLAPFVYGGPPDPLALRSIRHNKQQVEHRVRAADRFYSHVKEGFGGIRDIEFAVQLTQLRVGHARREVQSGNTLAAIEALTRAGVLTSGLSTHLSRGYVLLRRVEHALQIVQESRESVLPSDARARAILGARLGFPSLADFDHAYRETTRAVRGAFEALFNGELGSAFAEQTPVQRWVLGDEAALADARAALQAAGFRDGDAAQARLAELAGDAPDSRERLSAIVEELLVEASGSGDPDSCIANLERVVRSTHAPASLYWFLSDYPAAIHRLCYVCGRSDALSEQMARRPELLDAMLEPGALDGPKPRAVLCQELAERLSFERGYEGRLRAIRLFRARESLRIGLRDVALDVRLEDTLAALSDLAEVCLESSLEAASRELQAPAPHGGLAILGLGKLGGRELHYQSDLDVVFVAAADAADGYDKAYAVARRLMQDLPARAPEGMIYSVDPRLRPGGREGPLVATLAGLRAYYGTRGHEWERLASVRARFVCGAPVAGEKALETIHEFAYSGEWTADERAEIHRVRGLIARERGRPAPNEFDVKLGPGGTLDLEVAVQAIQAETGSADPTVRVPSTLGALAALGRSGALEPERARAAIAAYRVLRTVESRLRILREPSTSRVSLAEEDLHVLAAKLPLEGRHKPMTGVDLAAELECASREARRLYGRAIAEIDR